MKDLDSAELVDEKSEVVEIVRGLLRHETVPIDTDVRSAIRKVAKNLCAYCRAAPVEQIDHIVPVSLGGPDCLENYAGTCVSCNQRKGPSLFPAGILGVLLVEAERRAPVVRREKDRLFERRLRSLSPRKPKPKASVTKRSSHSVLLKSDPLDIMRMIGLDAEFPDGIPLEEIAEDLEGVRDEIMGGELVLGPYAGELGAMVENGRLHLNDKMIGALMSCLTVAEKNPRLVTGPDWRFHRIHQGSVRTRSAGVFFSWISMPLEDAVKLHAVLEREGYPETVKLTGPEAKEVSGIINRMTGLGAIQSGRFGFWHMFPSFSGNSQGISLDMSPMTGVLLGEMIKSRSASLIFTSKDETNFCRLHRDMEIGRIFKVRPGVLTETPISWRSEPGLKDSHPDRSVLPTSRSAGTVECYTFAQHERNENA